MIVTRKNWQIRRLIAIIVKNRLYVPGGVASKYFRQIAADDSYDTGIKKMAVEFGRTPTSTAIGWAVIVDEREFPQVWAYVSPEHRRQGVGTRLVLRVQKGYHTLQAYQLSLEQERFWGSFGRVFVESEN